jgi:hypothetical protein
MKKYKNKNIEKHTHHVHHSELMGSLVWRQQESSLLPLLASSLPMDDVLIVATAVSDTF